MLKQAIWASVVGLLLALPATSQAKVVEYDLTIAYKTVNITGKPVRAITVNGQIPGPTLRFHQSDSAVIHVHNKLDVGSSIHWHGMLVPPDMDGVPFISFPPIAPGSTFTYRFPIRQEGTYWYHSHSGLQEQKGVYGAIVIEPKEPRLSYDREQAVVLSDWTDEPTKSVMRRLKRGSEWYSVQKGAGQSLLGAIKAGRIGDYFKRELLRMPPMDISDVAYDRFLANGQPQYTVEGKPGETIRLRIVDGSSTTFFHLQFAGGPLKVISADGQNVVPFQIQRLLIAVAETYDVLVTVPDTGAYELRATAHDGSAFASIWIGSGKRHFAPTVPRPDLYRMMGSLKLSRIFALTPAASMGMTNADVRAGKFDHPGMMGMGSMGGMDMSSGMPGMSMSGMPGMSMPDTANAMPGMPGMSMPMQPDSLAQTGTVDSALYNGKRFGKRFVPLATDVSAGNIAVDGTEPWRPGPPYSQLRSIHPTAFDSTTPVHIVRLTLDGDMERYVWSINNKTLSESDSIVVHRGEVVRFIMINRTMMHHPMHLHGHFFRVINGQGDYSPLKHTVDVAPMSTTVIEFKADEFGEWFFHCHLLYHLKSGMARTVHYQGYQLPADVVPVRGSLYHDSWYTWADGDALSNMTSGVLTAANTRNILMSEWEVGWRKSPVTEWEGIVTWNRYFDRFLSLFAGGDFYGATRVRSKGFAIAGLHYLLPLNVHTRVWLAHDASVRLAFDKELMLLPRLAINGETEYDSNTKWQGRIGTTYMIDGRFSLTAQWHSDYGWGGGLTLHL